MFLQPVLLENPAATKARAEILEHTTDILSNQVVIAITGFIIAGLLGIVVWFIIREISKKDKIAVDLENFESKITTDIKRVTDNFTTELRDMANRSTTALESLNKAISQLALAMTEQRVWMSEHYVSKSDYKEGVEIIHARITKNVAKLEILAECPRKDCPVNNGDPRATWPGGPLPGSADHGNT
jgi:archaellum component FlaC